MATPGKKAVRGWMGVDAPAPRPTLSLEEGSYVQQPLSLDQQNALNAKITLLTCTQPDQTSLYEHLSSVLTNVLEQPPEGALDILEPMSQQFKTSRMRTNPNFKEVLEKGHNPGQMEAEWNLFKTLTAPIPGAEADDNLTDPEEDKQFLCLPNLARQSFLFSQAGCGLPEAFYVRVTLAFRELARAWPLVSLRLWGVVMGLQRDYTVAEGEMSEGDYDTDYSDDEANEQPQQQLYDDLKEEELDDELYEDIKPAYKPPRKIPCEQAGVGLNRKVYFVCTQPGSPWVRLPHVTPAQITAARKIRKYLTGHLDHKMVTFPPFPGTERNYLRAQIARISASTHVSPIGVFKFEEEGEEEEEAGDGARDTCVVDPDFEGVKMSELCDPSLMNWVHHAQYILPQGRASWFNPVSRTEGEEGEDEGEEEERNEPDEPEPEVGPPLLTPLAEDTTGSDQQPAWITRTSSKLIPEFASTTVHSTVWPGATAIATDSGRFFENLYVGWGVKSTVDNMEPALPDPPLDEFPTGPEVMEAEDPSPETEAAIRAAMREQEAAAQEEEEDDGIIDDDDGGADLSD